jgi:site-specific recombinase XerD
VESAQAGTPLKTAIADFIAGYSRESASEAYREELQSYLVGNGRRTTWNPLLPWASAQGIHTTAELTRERLEQYLAQAQNGRGRPTYRKMCGITSLFLKHLAAMGTIDRVPLEIVRPKRLRTEIRVFTETEMLRLLAPE